MIVDIILLWCYYVNNIKVDMFVKVDFYNVVDRLNVSKGEITD